jgi:hypothetical protein
MHNACNTGYTAFHSVLLSNAAIVKGALLIENNNNISNIEADNNNTERRLPSKLSRLRLQLAKLNFCCTNVAGFMT